MENKVLFVDDEKNILNTLKIELRGCDFEPFAAYSGEEALRILEKEKIPVVISDMRMPEMNGVKLLTKVRELYPDTIRMILSEYSDIDSILESINNGKIYRYITKPWKIEDLKITINQALEHYNFQKERKKFIQKLADKNKELQKLNNKQEELISQLQDALEQVKTLKGLLPICAYCKKIRVPNSDPFKQESWQAIEKYISSKTDSEFSHGICPECSQKYFSEFNK